MHVLSYANDYLEREAGVYCDDVEADIGLLMCELEYLLGRREEPEVEKQMKGIKKGGNLSNQRMKVEKQ